MSKTVNDFLGFGVGDMITLSDIQTQFEYDDLNADFKIQEVRRYHEPNDFFTYSAYLCKYKGGEKEKMVMVLVRQMGADYDLLVFYLDQDGDVSEYAIHLITGKEVKADEEGDEEDTEEVDSVFDDDGFPEGGVEGGEETDEEPEEEDSTTEDLIDKFEITMNFDKPDANGDSEYDVTWDKKDAGSTFGVEFHSTDGGDDTKTIAEYFTNDENRGNPHCFIEWTGDSQKGWIEMWYGCEIKPEDIEIFRAKKI